MRVKASMLLVASTVALAVRPAFADWQYTRWGMTVQEVVAASKGQVHEVPPDPQQRRADKDRLAVGQYPVEDVQFEADFMFDGQRRLAAVALSARTRDSFTAEKVRSALIAKYGQPTLVRGPGSLQWSDQANNNLVQFYWIPAIGSLQVIYDPGTGALQNRL